MCSVGFVWGVYGSELHSCQVVNVSNGTNKTLATGWIFSSDAFNTPLPVSSAFSRQVSSGWCHTVQLLEGGDVYVASTYSVTQAHSGGQAQEDAPQPLAEASASCSLGSRPKEHRPGTQQTTSSSSSIWQPVRLVQQQHESVSILQLPYPVPVIQVSAGDQHCLLLDQSGRVWAFGSNSNGQTGCAPSAADAATKISVLAAAAAAAPAVDHAIATAVTDGALAYGVDPAMHSIGQLTASPHAVLVLGPGSDSSCQEQIAQIAAGSCHSVAISAVTGRLYTWGWAAHGQCGTGSTADVGQPTLCSALDGVPLAAAAAGMAHTLVVSRDGAVYSFGWNNNGQLGVGNCQQDASGAVQQQPLLSSLVPMLVEDSLLDQEHVVQVACGSRHSVVLTATGRVYTWGFNKYGQCCTARAERAPLNRSAALSSGSGQETSRETPTASAYTSVARYQPDLCALQVVELPSQVELPAAVSLGPHQTDSTVSELPQQQVPEGRMTSVVRTFSCGPAIRVQAGGWYTFIELQAQEQ